MNIQNFIDNAIQSSHAFKTYHLLPWHYALEIKVIASVSIAKTLQLQPEDLLLKINDKPACLTNIYELLIKKENIQYLFYQKKLKQYLEVIIKPIILGLILEPTNKAIAYKRQLQQKDSKDLLILWEGKEWILLKKYCKKWIFFPSKEIIDFFMCGIALYELGNRKKGLKIIQNFAEKQAHQWDIKYSAICIYYAARQALIEKKIQKAILLLQEAYQYYPYPVFSHLLETLTWITPSNKPYWLNSIFPIYYELIKLRQDGEIIALKQCLENMQNHQIMIIALYFVDQQNDFIANFSSYYQAFSDFIYDFHIITNIEQPDIPQYDNCPASILYDAEKQVLNLFDSPQAIVFIVIDNSGVVVYQGLTPNEVTLWNSLLKSSEITQINE